MLTQSLTGRKDVVIKPMLAENMLAENLTSPHKSWQSGLLP
jgi:hypothetical protein